MGSSAEVVKSIPHTLHIISTMPRYVSNFVTPCKQMFKTCDDSFVWSEHEQTLCQSYTAPVFNYYNILFRNKDCVSCNEYQGTVCSFPFSKYAGRIVGYFTFSMLIDFIDRTVNQIVRSTGSCGKGKKWDKSHKKCRKVICAREGEEFFYGRCVRP